jgi:hypothetical protein
MNKRKSEKDLKVTGWLAHRVARHVGTLAWPNGI